MQGLSLALGLVYFIFGISSFLFPRHPGSGTFSHHSRVSRLFFYAPRRADRDTGHRAARGTAEGGARGDRAEMACPRVSQHRAQTDRHTLYTAFFTKDISDLSYLLFSCLNSSTCLSSHRCFASSSREPTLQASCTPSSQSIAANDSDSEPHKSGSRLARRDRIHLCMRLVAAERGVSLAVPKKGSNGRPNVSTCARNASAALD